MIWTIQPGRGLGPLAFGMTPDEVMTQPGLGRPGHVYRGSLGRRMEYRGLGVPICEYGPEGLNRIVTGRLVRDVEFQGLNFFDVDPAAMVRLLESRLGPVTLCQEQLCFRKAGVMLGGFFDPLDQCFFEPRAEYHDERSITLYTPGSCTADEAEPEQHEALSFL